MHWQLLTCDFIPGREMVLANAPSSGGQESGLARSGTWCSRSTRLAVYGGGGGQQYPKEATQQHSGPSAGPPAFPGAGALWDSPLVTYVPSRLSPDWAVLEPSVLCS